MRIYLYIQLKLKLLLWTQTDCDWDYVPPIVIVIVDSDRDTDSHCDSQSRIEILMFAPRAIKTSSQGSFSLKNVRSDEKTARRTVILARNADIRTVARETPEARRAPE